MTSQFYLPVVMGLLQSKQRGARTPGFSAKADSQKHTPIYDLVLPLAAQDCGLGVSLSCLMHEANNTNTKFASS